MKKVFMFLVAPMLALLVGCTPPAATSNCAALSGYEVVTMQTPVNSDPMKQLEIKCPEGKYATGAGWSVEDSTSAILDGTATYFQPGYDGKSWLVNAKNNSAFAPKWKLRLTCMCANICDTTKSKATPAGNTAISQ